MEAITLRHSVGPTLRLVRCSLPSRHPQGQASFPVRRRHCPRTRSAASMATSSAPPKSTPFARVKTRDQLMEVIKGAGVDEKVKQGMVEFYNSYEDAVKSSGVPDPEAVSVDIMGAVFDRVTMQSIEPYTFPSHHLSIREPYDYYEFGQKYIKALIDYKHSYVGNVSIFREMREQLQQGHNIVLLANHQTEGDPGVMAHMLEPIDPFLATSLTYVAGDRVVLDPFCKPFSMGRNLLCVHSKKRLHDIPELTEQKLAANRRTLKEMAKLFKKGGNFIWVAPSGGRDRPDPVTGEWTPAAFDPSAVELMRRLASEAGRPFHMHPLAMLCYDIMPPPKQLEKELLEKRVIGHHGVGISVAPEILFETVTSASQDRKQQRDAYSKAVESEVVKHYQALSRAINGEGQSASTPDIQLSQPWA